MLGGVVFSTSRTFLADNAGIGLCSRPQQSGLFGQALSLTILPFFVNSFVFRFLCKFIIYRRSRTCLVIPVVHFQVVFVGHFGRVLAHRKIRAYPKVSRTQQSRVRRFVRRFPMVFIPPRLYNQLHEASLRKFFNNKGDEVIRVDSRQVRSKDRDWQPTIRATGITLNHAERSISNTSIKQT